ncbi:hypothetical protein L7F22_035391 [Adiantum nelumboides]|nr:hypothetical protein [Adiantum nelumboides]
MVKLFMHNVSKYHGMPQSIVSDRDPRMTSLFWKALFENMGTPLKFSSSFHTQTDGQSEEANSIVLDLLKCYVSEHKASWEHYLPLVEYAYNNTVHTSTGKAPFEIAEGGKKFPPILHTKDKIFEADKYVQNTDEAYKKIKLALEKTQSKQKKAADRHRRELVFSLGDWVLLRFEKARLRKMKGKERLFPKLGMRYYGPFQILAHKDRKVRGKIARRYLVKFKNYSPMDAKWMEEVELVEDYNEPNLEAWKKFDDGRDLSTYDFSSDGLGETKDLANNQKLAYRHRWISELYLQGLETLLTAEQLQEWQELYELTDSHTDGWLTAGRTILQSCVESSASEAEGNCSMGLGFTSLVNVVVTSGSLVPSLVKILLFKLNKFISHEHVYSSTEVGKLQCFHWIRQQFVNPRSRFCVIGDGLDECEAAEALKWPFIKIDPQPYGHIRLPALSVQVINNYMRVIYGNEDCL